MKWLFAKAHRLGLAIFFFFSMGAASTHRLDAEVPFRLKATYLSLLREHGLRWEKVSDLDEKSARAFIKAKLVTLTDLLHPQPDPYTGKVEMPKRCRAENVPPLSGENHPDAFVEVFSLYSTASFVLGSCPQRGAIKTHQIFLYCRKSRVLYLISAFFKAGVSWPPIPSVSCDI